MDKVFFAMAIAAVLWGVVVTILVASALRKRGITINPWLWRIRVFRYLDQYKAVTVAETGRVGPLYHAYVRSMVAALVLALLGLAFRVTG